MSEDAAPVFSEDNQDCAFQSTSSHENLTTALRDLFIAVNNTDLLEALNALPGICVSDVTELEYEFNRLFVGPIPPLAPPYASVYLEKEPRLMGETTLAIARFYNALGLRPSREGVPADFLPLELEASLAICNLPGNKSEMKLAMRFLCEHMNSWLPLFTGRLRSCDLSPTMTAVADLLEIWLEAEKEKLC